MYSAVIFYYNYNYYLEVLIVLKIRLFGMSCKLPFWQQEVRDKSYSAIQCSILFSSYLSCLMVCVLPLHLDSVTYYIQYI